MTVQRYSPLPNDGNSADFIAVPPPLSEASIQPSPPRPSARDDINPSADAEGCTTQDKFCLGVFVFLILPVGVYITTILVSDAYNDGAYDVEITHISGLNTTSPIVNTDISFVIEARDPHEHPYYDMVMYVDVDGENIGAGFIPLDSFHTTPFSIVISSGPWTLNSDTLELLADNAQNLPLSVTAYAKYKTYGEPFDLHCKMTVDLTRTNGTQLTYHRCKTRY